MAKLPAAMVLLNARGLHKAYGPQTILDGADLSIHPGERVGLVGVNGSGKSTLARILAGLEEADGGEVTHQRGARIAYLPQTPQLTPGRTVIEEVMEGLADWSMAKQRFDELSAELERGEVSGEALEQLVAAQTDAAAEVERLGGWEVSHRAEAVLERLGVRELRARVERLSGGEQRRVALAKILVGRPQLALLDEPTNHLDLAAIEWLEGHLRDEYPGALLLVTHDRYLIDAVAQRTAELEGGKLRCYEGGYQDYLEAKAERMVQEARAEANRQRFVRQELEWLRRQPKARTGKQKARIQRAESAIADQPTAAGRALRLELEGKSKKGSKRVLQLTDLTLELGGRTLVSELDHLVMRGERVGILGPNGCGKTTLLRAITGELEPTGGAVWRSANTTFAYLDQTRAGLDEQASILDAVADGQRKVQVGGRPVDVEAYLARFLFPKAKIQQKISALSGGERTRVALARLLCKPANLVILDEPTNDLDVPTIAALEQMLVEQASTAIVVTHDRWFLDRVATAILAFEGEGRVVPYQGNFTIYSRLRALQQREAQAAAAQSSAATRAERKREQRAAKPKGLTYGERIELEGLMEKVEAADGRVAELEQRLADPATYTEGGGQDVAGIATELDQAKREAAALEARWEELELKREGQQDER